MNYPWAGRHISGNFKISHPVENLNKYKVTKHGGSLFLIEGIAETEMIPSDDHAHLIIEDFSDDEIENESIYAMQKSQGISNSILLILYLYKGKPIKLFGNEKMVFYVSRGDLKTFADKTGFDESGLNDFLTSQFVFEDRHLFVMGDDKHHSNRDSLIGKEWFADFINEGNIVNRITRLRKRRDRSAENPFHIFGNVGFVPWDKALTINGKLSANLTEVSIPQIFNAWGEFLAFEKESFLKKRRRIGKILFDKITVDFDAGIVSVQISKENESSQLLDRDEAKEGVDCYICDLVERENFAEEGNENPNINKVFLGEVRSYDPETRKAIFKPKFTNFNIRNLGATAQTQTGFLMLSAMSMEIQTNRRLRIIEGLSNKSNSMGNVLMNLADSAVEDRQTPTRFQPIDSSTLEAMFGKGKGDTKINENYRRAMDIAINTPDIAIIQGPPGTGKTTLIRGIAYKLLANKSRNYKILITAEQHDALHHAVGGVAKTSSIPPYVSSTRFSADQEDADNEERMRHIRTFQNRLEDNCQSILKEQGRNTSFSNYVLEAIVLFRTIKDGGYDFGILRNQFANLQQIVLNIGLSSEYQTMLSNIRFIVNQTASPTDEKAEITQIQNKIKGQRTDSSSWADDGFARLIELQILLSRDSEYLKLLIDDNLKERLTTDATDADFKAYRQYVRNIEEYFLPRENPLSVEPKAIVKNNIEAIERAIKEKARTRSKDFYDIIEEFSYLAKDELAISKAVKIYTDVIGSTCAQAAKSVDYVKLTASSYDYVIIDEASRANPIDLMLPIFMGKKVVLVGDHKQLPHYLESQMVDEFEKNGSGEETTYLKRSLFEQLYENLDQAYREGRIKARRTIRLQEQHRMAPDIAGFIASEFYSDGDLSNQLTNGAEAIKNINDFGVFDGHSVAFLNVPSKFGYEEEKHKSRIRFSECLAIAESIGKIEKHRALNGESEIGIISFYNGQVEQIRNLLAETFSADFVTKHIKIGTVDSFQGMEFDIVYLSTVRCNGYTSIRKKLGFLYEQPNRVNVSLSRAKKLLVVVGDRETLHAGIEFRHFIEYTKEKGGYFDYEK